MTRATKTTFSVHTHDPSTTSSFLPPPVACVVSPLPWFSARSPRPENWTGANPQQDGAVGAVEVHRGPLSFALRPAVNMTNSTTYAGSKSCGQRELALADGASWNYALDLGADAAAAAARGDLSEFLMYEVDDAALAQMRASRVPFDADAAPPARVRAHGRVVDAWTVSGGGARPPSPPDSPVSSDNALEELELVPFGMTNLRTAVFPVLAPDAAAAPLSTAAAPPSTAAAPSAAAP